MSTDTKNDFGVSADDHNCMEVEKKQFDDIEDTLEDLTSVNKEKQKIIKNLLLLCAAFFLNFIAFNSTSSLQSSLNYEEGLGTGSQAIIYGALIFSALFVPTFVIKWLGCKWTICVSIIGYVTYPLANFYPTWWTLVPSSVIVGLSAAPLWSAESTYITTAAHRYAKLTNETPTALVARFFGIFYFLYQFNNIVGQLISSFVLSSGDDTNLVLPDCYNSSYIETYCGSHDCQEDFNAARIEYSTTECPVTQIQSEGVKTSLLYTLMGIYAGIGLMGALVLGLFLDPITVRSNETRSPFDLLVATFKQLKDYRQLCLICITAYNGFQQAFLTGDFTRSFISCPLAVNWVGFVLICYGGCDSLCSFLFGNIAKYTGRISVFTVGFVTSLALIIIFLIWTPYPTDSVLFFVYPSFWGLADAVWHTQINAFYGVVFASNQEAAFANYMLWLSVGKVIAFAYQRFLCVSTKLWILLGVLLVGMLFYYIVEFLEMWEKNKTAIHHSKEKDTSDTSEDLDEKRPMFTRL